MELVSYMYHFTSATASNMGVWNVDHFLTYIDLSHCCCVCVKMVGKWLNVGKFRGAGTHRGREDANTETHVRILRGGSPSDQLRP